MAVLTAIQRSTRGQEVIPNLEYGSMRQPDVIVLAKNQSLGAEKDTGTNTGDCQVTVRATSTHLLAAWARTGRC